MADVAVSGGEVIPPGTLSLSDLIARVNHEHKQVKECIIKGAQHAVKAGELLWEAKRKAGHGRWLEWIAASRDLGAGMGAGARERAKYLSEKDWCLAIWAGLFDK